MIFENSIKNQFQDIKIFNDDNRRKLLQSIKLYKKSLKIYFEKLKILRYNFYFYKIFGFWFKKILILLLPRKKYF